MAHLDGVHVLVAGLLYGGGLRLVEALRLRIKDVDFEKRAVVVRHALDGKPGEECLDLGRAQLATMIYTHVLNRGGRGGHSPMDAA